MPTTQSVRCRTIAPVSFLLTCGAVIVTPFGIQLRGDILFWRSRAFLRCARHLCLQNATQHLDLAAPSAFMACSICFSQWSAFWLAISTIKGRPDQAWTIDVFSARGMENDSPGPVASRRLGSMRFPDRGRVLPAPHIWGNSPAAALHHHSDGECHGQVAVPADNRG